MGLKLRMICLYQAVSPRRRMSSWLKSPSSSSEVSSIQIPVMLYMLFSFSASSSPANRIRLPLGSIDNLLKLSEVLGVSLEYLLKGNQDDGFSPLKQNESKSQVYPIELLYSYVLNYNDSIEELGWKKGSVIGFYRLNSTGWTINIADAFYEGPDGSENESAHDDPSDYLAVTIDDLFHDPKNYDGCLVKVSAWVGCYAYADGLSEEGFEEVMLISDQDYLQKEDEEVYSDHELLFGRYYNKIIRQNHVPYAVAVIKPERLTEIPEAVNVEMTVYGKFTYHPEYDRDSIYV